jgi:hypothetical protein
MVKVYLIRDIDTFYLKLKELKDDAKMGNNNNVFLIGIDIEFIAKANYPKSFASSVQWVENNTTIDTVACTLQLSSTNVCLVINLIDLGCMPNKLKNIIMSGSWIKMGVGVDMDMKILSANYCLDQCNGGFDVKNIAQINNHPNPNLESLYNQYVGGNIKKKGNCSKIHDWTKKLTIEQINYAAMDAIMSYQLGMFFIDGMLIKMNQFKVDDILLEFDDELNTNVSVHIVDKYHNKKSHTEKKLSSNYIGQLNEICQKSRISIPKYKCIKQSGPDHKPTFTYEISIILNDEIFKEVASGESVKKTKMNVAKLMIEFIETIN